MRKFYHIEFAKTGLGISGGETCMVELIRYLSSIGEKNVVLTTDNGKKVYEELGLLESGTISYQIINSYDDEKRYHVFIAYFKRLSKIKNLLKYVFFQDQDVVFCHSDFFPNFIPLYWISRKFKKMQFIYFFHMLAPSIFRGFQGEFIKKYHIPNLGIVHYKINQLLYLFIISSIGKGQIVAVNSYYKEYLDKKIKNSQIKKHFLSIFGGVQIPNIRQQRKIYDGAWMGRFHAQKGVQELFVIIKKLKVQKPDVKIVVIGGGSQEVEQEFIQNIQKFGLERNIDYKGFLNGEERFEILSQSKIFLMTSYFEGRPIVMLELLKLGIPIVAYDLPVYGVYDKGIVKVGILDNNAFSEKVLNILDDSELYEQLSLEAKDFSKDYSWENTGKEIYQLIK